MFEWIAVAVVVAVAGAGCAVWMLLRSRNMENWIASYLRRRVPDAGGRTRHVMFCFVDHYEPMWKGADLATQRARVDRWCSDYPAMASRHRDADGRPPQHTFFYPAEEYAEEHLDKLARLCADGFGEIEVHLHHHDDTEQGFRDDMSRFCDILHERHGALTRDPRDGRLRFGFIHGNWSLDNSRRDGQWCGLDNELVLLRELGCYADFTLPSAPSDTQTSTINAIYYATDDPLRPKSHDRGEAMRVGGSESGDLTIIQGPLCLNWRERRFGLIPKIESSDVRRNCPPTAGRVDDWVRTGVHVEGRPEWVFVKVHTHGAQDLDMDTLLGDPMDAMHAHLQQRYNDGVDNVLHYVTARELYNIAKAAEAGMNGDPGSYRDFLLPPPTSSWSRQGRA